MARNPSQNGVAERMNRTLLEKTRCLLLDSNFGKEIYTEISPPDSARHTVTPEGVTRERTETQDVEDTHMDYNGFTPEEVSNESTREDFELNFAVNVLALSVSGDAPECYKDAVKDVGWRRAIN
ncbi:hypothetical protein PR048_005904 [Dryococelus australis]|uniref:Integrase catalytic domain-containing protein n=1 Tax=Dryococelus australis TaxID=614101 RepID=A0ABQ9I9H0_9NEOP|nr:hypothetical protein PR048_005904 [Dryococelus australis]